MVSHYAKEGGGGPVVRVIMVLQWFGRLPLQVYRQVPEILVLVIINSQCSYF